MRPRLLVLPVFALSLLILSACFTSKQTTVPETPLEAAEERASKEIPADLAESEATVSKSSPLDLPLGVWDVWGERDWQFAIQRTNEHGDSQLLREFERLNRLGATFMIGDNGNEAIIVRAHQLGELDLGIAMTSIATYEDSSQIFVRDDRIPGDRQRNMRLKDVIRRYVEYTDLSDSTTRQQAFSLIDEIIASQRTAYGNDYEATPYYLLLKEGWERGGSVEDNREYSLLFEYAVNKIREWDSTRGIVYFGAYAMEAMRETFTPEELSDPAILDSVFSGKLMRGWNAFNIESYPFRAKRGGRNWVLDNYAGRYYHRSLSQWAWWLRLLSRDVERYAEAVQPIGPRPEWWLDVQVMREEWIYPDGKFEFRYRRPTRWEYALQAYVAVACGARGITTYPYGSNLMMDQYTNMDGDPLPRQRAVRTFKSHHKNIHGFVSADWWQIEDTTTVANYRKPFSEVDEYPDYFPTGTQYEPYPGHHYPFDRIVDMNANLRSLLPKVRALRWWWAADGLDNSYIDYAGSRGENVYPRKSIADWMADEQPIHHDLTLGERFRLRAIKGDDDGPLPSDAAKYASNVFVGMFDDPANPDYELYLLVNLTTNAVVEDYVIPASAETVAQLVFHGNTPLDAQLIWQDLNRDDRVLDEAYASDDGAFRLDVPLLPGDCKLIQVRSR